MTDDAPQLRGELRQLSSVDSEAGPALSIVLAGVLTIAGVIAIVMGQAMPGLMLLGGGAVLGLAMFFRRLKVVETDGYWLLVSDWSKTVWIPLRQVDSVSRVLVLGRDRVSVKLCCDTPFGREIVFEPLFRLSALIGPHPVVEELRELVAHAKAAGEGLTRDSSAS